MYYLDLNKAFIMRGNQELPLSRLSLSEFFDFVKNIPYRRDPKPIEVTSRPYFILKYRNLGMDCKKKNTLICAFLRMKNLKYRAIGSSSRPDHVVHHIYMEFFDQNKKEWRPVDSTYPENVLFNRPPQETYREVLK